MSIIELSIRRPVALSMFTLAILVFGLVVSDRMGLTLFPPIEYPTLTVKTEFESAAPAEVENLITKPIEESLGTISNIKEIHSISRAGESEVVLYFHWGTNMTEAGLDVREKLDIVQLPLEVKKPRLLRYNPSLDPIVKLNIYKESGKATESDLIELRRFAEEKVKRKLESIDGLAAVKLNGGLEDQIQILLDQQKLKQLGLSIELVGNIIGAENVNLSGGKVEQGTQQFLVRTVNEFRSIEEIEETIISNADGKFVRLKDIASVKSSFKDRDSITRFGTNETVELAIYKEGDANTVAVSQSLEAKLNKLQKTIPSAWKLVTTYDQATFIESAINEVITNALLGGLLAMLVLYAFLQNLRSTLIISIAIPVSIIASFNLMFASDISFNVMSLGGIALAVGLLVDNAIVVLENIARVKEQQKDPSEAAAAGTKEVAGAITASTLTTLAVFVPLIFVQGVAGQIFHDQALTVTYTLLASLFIALTLIPMLSAKKSSAHTRKESETENLVPSPMQQRFAKVLCRQRELAYKLLKGLGKLIEPFTSSLLSLYQKVSENYPRLLSWALENKALTIFVALASFAATLALIPLLQKELIPSIDQGELVLKAKAPTGTTLMEMDSLMQTIAQKLTEIEQVKSTFSIVGGGDQLSANTETQAENQGRINIVLERGFTSKAAAVSEKIREVLAAYPTVEFDIAPPALFTFKTPLEIELYGYDLAELDRQTTVLMTEMKKDKRFADIRSTLREGRPEIQIYFDHQKANHLGLSVPELARVVADKVKGKVATRYAFADRKIDVLVRLEEQQRNSTDDIKDLIVYNKGGKAVKLSAVAAINVGRGPSEIHRVAQERVAIVSASLNYGGLEEAAKEIQTLFEILPMSQNIDMVVAGQNAEMTQSYDSLYMALILAVFLVYVVMASQFESFLHPFIILFSVPMAFTGALLALFLTSSTVSIIVFIGLIMLAGIVVNNAIVLVDRINQARASGLEKYTAIQEACLSRLRPIMITSLTTILGMLPLAIGFGEGAEIRAPMAITVIGGLLVSTLLTLLVVPVLYAAVEGRRS